MRRECPRDLRVERRRCRRCYPTDLPGFPEPLVGEDDDARDGHLLPAWLHRVRDMSGAAHPGIVCRQLVGERHDRLVGGLAGSVSGLPERDIATTHASTKLKAIADASQWGNSPGRA